MAGLRTTVLLVEDHQMVAEGIRRLLDGEPYHIEVATDGKVALERAIRAQPDIILLDLSLPLMSGLEVAREVKAAGIRSKVVFLTMHTDHSLVREAIQNGAVGYVLKRSASADLITALREVSGGRTYISGELISWKATRPDKSVRTKLVETPAARGQLTERQRQVLQLVAEGLSNKEIAYQLSISVKTVEFHKSSIMRELQLHSTAELTRYAIKYGLITEVG